MEDLTQEGKIDLLDPPHHPFHVFWSSPLYNHLRVNPHSIIF